jgi:hypothetical protein
MTSHECHGRCAALAGVIAGFAYRLIDVGSGGVSTVVSVVL